MSVELKEFGGASLVKDKALKRDPDLKPLAIKVKTTNKATAEAIIAGKLAEHYPANIDDYFKVKVWEHREGLPRITAEYGVFCSEFFSNIAAWNPEAGEPVAAPEADYEERKDEPALKLVSALDKASRAAALVLFGPVTEISSAQYGQIVDLISDEDGHFDRELAEAVSRESRVLALATERQIALLAWVRETAKESAQWTDLVKLLAKWLDTPVDKRPQASTSNDNRTDTGATLGGGNITDRGEGFLHNLATLRIDTCMGVLSTAMDFDIYSPPTAVSQRACKMDEAGTDPRFSAWWKQFRRTPGILDYSLASIISLIKTAPEDLYLKPIELREYINRNLVESDHANPLQAVVDIACGRSSAPLPQKQESTHDETQPSVSVETEIPAVCPVRAAELDKELNAAFEQTGKQLAAGRGEFVSGISDPADPKWVDGSAQPKIENLGGGMFSVDALTGSAPSNEGEKQEVPPALSERELEIAVALNDLLSGRTRIVDKADVSELLQAASQKTASVIPLLMQDIATTEFCLSPDFSELEIQDVATTILENWSDDINVRQKVALDAIVEFRKPAPPKSAAPISTAKASNDAEPEQITAPALSGLSYRQQLTIAALNGLCANPAYCHARHDLPLMAIDLANDVIDMQDGVDAD